jgi:peptidoglycan/xylan/chitin deacetylase (PgdA/CDA1 family)
MAKDNLSQLKKTPGLSAPLVKLLILFILVVCSTIYVAQRDIQALEVTGAVIPVKPVVKPRLFADIPIVLPTASPSPTLKPTPTDEVPAPGDYCLEVPMLYYHHIEPLAQAKSEGHGQLTVDASIFDIQMNYLVTHGYQTMTSSDVVDALRNHTTLPPKSVVLSFDDGYTDIYTYAYPLFKKYNVHADLMIATGLVGNPDYLTWDQIKDMAGNSLIHIYNHTWSHAALGILPKDKIEFEVNTAEQQIQDHLGIKPLVFTYPYGSMSSLAIQTLQSLGYTGGLSTVGGKLQCESHIMSLHRNAVGNTSLVSYGL